MALDYLGLAAGLTISMILASLAWRLVTMPEWERKQLRERYEVRMRNRAMIRFLRKYHEDRP